MDVNSCSGGEGGVPVHFTVNSDHSAQLDGATGPVSGDSIIQVIGCRPDTVHN